jgi:hypothetical protein
MSAEHTSSDATDIFSLSDRVLAEKLQFVKEVHSISFGIEYPLITMAHIILLDWLWKLGQRLVMPTESTRWCQRHETSGETCAPIQDDDDRRPRSVIVRNFLCDTIVASLTVLHAGGMK